MKSSTSLIQIIANYDESTVMQTQRLFSRAKTGCPRRVRQIPLF